MTKAISSALFAAAATMIGVSAAPAQNMKAEIPFEFRTSNATLPAGAYTLNAHRSGGSSLYYQLTNVATLKSVLAVAGPPIYSIAKVQSPKLVFVCGSNGCVLDQAWAGEGGTGYSFSHFKSAREREARLVTISLTPVRAD